MNHPMHLERFTGLLDSYGADLTQWPAPERGAAERLLSTAPQAQAAWRAACDIERFLAEPPRVESARIDGLVAAVARRARDTQGERFLVLLFGRMPAPFASALCAGLLALGWMVGGLHPQTIPASTPDVALLIDEVPVLFDGGQR